MLHNCNKDLNNTKFFRLCFQIDETIEILFQQIDCLFSCLFRTSTSKNSTFSSKQKDHKEKSSSEKSPKEISENSTEKDLKIKNPKKQTLLVHADYFGYAKKTKNG